jgi:hypothetical protein
MLKSPTKPFSRVKKTCLGAVLAASCWAAASAWGAEPAADAPKAEDADKPEYTKRGAYAGGAQHPAPCEHKMHLPLLIPQTGIDNKEYCGGKITLF